MPKQFDETEIVSSEEKAIEHNELVEELKESLLIGQAGFLKAGSYLKKIRDEKTYQYEDSSETTTFNKFLERPDLPVPGRTIQSRRRTAFTLIKVYDQLINKHQVEELRLAPIGWTKLDTVARVLEKDPNADADEWLSKAETLTVRDLEQEARSGQTLAEELACEHKNLEEITLYKCPDCKNTFRNNPNE